MATAQNSIAQRYQQPIWGRMDRALRNCFTGSGILGLILLIAIFVVPKPPPVAVTVEDIPERIARLILQKPKPIPAIPAPTNVADAPPAEVVPEPVAKPKPKPRTRRTSKPTVAQNKGTEGRQKAQKEVTQNLAAVTGSLDKVMDNLAKSLPATDDGKAQSSAKRRRRGVRSGRSSEQLSTVKGVSDLSAPDVAGSAIQNEGISIAAITDLTVQEGSGDVSGATGGSSSGGSSGGGGEYRSSESLLSVVRRYAPGIQFCYDNELKKNPGLRGKLVVSMNVQANGRVSEALVVEDTLDSPQIRECVLAQIRGWQFPEIPFGVTSFKTPFIFTPPE